MLRIITILLAFSFYSCEQGNEAAPKKMKVKSEKQSGERRGGNGNGNGGGNQNTDPCANYPVYPIEYSPARDFGITVDTTVCGMVTFRWAPQAGFNPVTDTCYTIARYYYISFQNVGHTNGCENGGAVSSTNAYYYMLGAGCSVFPSYTYKVYVKYIERNTTLQKSIWHTSLPVTFTAGSRAPWLNNCI
jgi:hypothetical protein